MKESSKSDAIGVFDSGIGGLTVISEMIKQIPNEDIIYFGDTGRTPYGPRSAEIVKKFSLQDVNFLLSFNVKFIVVACNTATAFALEFLESKFDIPIIGVVKPGAFGASESTKSGKIGVIGTQGTIDSQSYQKHLTAINRSFEISAKPCPLFVSLAEEGYINKPATKLIAEDYLLSLKQKGIDTLILGCTHYPLLKEVIAHVMGSDVKLIDSAEETAKVARDELVKLNLLNDRETSIKRKFFVSDTPDKFKKIGERFLGREIGEVEKIDISKF